MFYRFRPLGSPENLVKIDPLPGSIKLAALLCKVFLGATIFTSSLEPLSSISAQEPKAIHRSNIVKVLSPTELELQPDARKAISIVAPDGSPVSKAAYITTRKYGEIDLEKLMRGEAKGMQRVGIDGMLPLPLAPGDEFVVIFNEQGFCSLSIDRVSMMSQIQLGAWSKLRIELKDDKGPIVGAKVYASNTTTTDGLYQGLNLFQQWTTDRKGSIETGSIPSGEWRVIVNPEMIAKGNVQGQVHERQIYVWVSEGETQKIEFGGLGRQITGKVRLPAGYATDAFQYLAGDVKSMNSNESVPLRWKGDGVFVSATIPLGPCEISIHPDLFSALRQGINLTGKKSFDCVEETGELSGPQIVGTIDVEVSRSRADNREPKNIDPDPTIVQDEFESTQRIAMVATVPGATPRYIFLDNEGKTIRILDNVIPAMRWGSLSQHVAFDRGRDRLYLLSSHDEQSSRQTLHTFRMTGQQVSKRALAFNQSHRIEVDGESGNQWLLGKESVDHGVIQIIDHQGRLKKSFPQSAFNMCYSEFDKAFWMTGPKEVQKVDPSTCEPIASYRLPDGVFALTQAIPGPEGGILSIEQLHPDLPRSKNRLWRFDSDANLVACADTGNAMMRSSAFVGNEIWTSGIRRLGVWSAVQGQRNVFTLRLDKGLHSLDKPSIEYENLGFQSGGKHTWAYRNGSLRRLSLTEEGSIKTEVAAEIRLDGEIWSGGIGD